jgi:adenylate kinase
MKDTLITGISGVGASVVTQAVAQAPDHTAAIIQLLIAAFTFISLMIQTFNKKEK